MISKPHAIAVAATLLISAPIWVAQAFPQSAIAAGGFDHDAALVTSASARHHYQKPYYYHAHYHYATLSYDGYRAYPPPIYHCPYYGSPIPLYPYCWGR